MFRKLKAISLGKMQTIPTACHTSFFCLFITKTSLSQFPPLFKFKNISLLLKRKKYFIPKMFMGHWQWCTICILLIKDFRAKPALPWPSLQLIFCLAFGCLLTLTKCCCENISSCPSQAIISLFWHEVQSDSIWTISSLLNFKTSCNL